MDAKDFEYKIKGLEEGYWRAIGNRDSETLRSAADILHDTLYDLAERLEEES